MPRFYLNVRQDETLVKDPEGSDFSSLDEARAEALLSARELMSARVLAGRKANHSKFEITDDNGNVVMVVWFEEAIIPG